MSVYQLKPKFQQLLLPLMRQLRDQKISPNHLTWAGMMISLIGGGILFIYPQTTWLLAPILLLRMCLNALDGLMARTYNLESREGAILNELGDLVSDLGLYLPFFFHAEVPLLCLLGLGIALVVTEFSGVLTWAVDGKRAYEGPMGKSDRAVLLGAYGMLVSLFPIAITWATNLGVLIIGAMAVSMYNRLSLSS